MNYLNQLRHLTRVALGVVLTLILNSSYAASVSQVITASDPDELEFPLKDIRRFTTVIAQIKNNYVESIDDNKLFDNAIRGLLSNLDPHSRYLDPEELKQLDTEVLGQAAGIGVDLASDENGEIHVIAPLDDSPAQKAGIQAGDLILKIDNSVVNNMTLNEANKKLQGKKGSTVALELVRSGVRKVIKLNVVRDSIKINHVQSKLLEGQYGYIRIPRFNEHVSVDTLKTIRELKQKSEKGGLKGLILDLRNNTGGLLNSAVEVAGLFLDVDKLKGNKKIVYTKGRGTGNKLEVNATKKDVTGGVPLVVLINKGSASGSEIVAGALQDHQRAVILGTQSFGKGSVQTVLPVDKQTAISLTTALYYTPLGRSIQAKGIKPDVEVEAVKLANFDPDQEGFSYREEDLTGHFNNANANHNVHGASSEGVLEEKNKVGKPQTTEIIKKNEEVERDLAHSDFQLYSALNLLKGFQAVKK